MKNLKNLLMFLGMVSCGSFVFSSQKPKTCWQSFTACFRPQVPPEDVARLKQQESLTKIRALQDSPGVAPREFVREYKESDCGQASAVFSENGFLAQTYLHNPGDDDVVCAEGDKVFVYAQDGVIKGVCSFMPAEGYIYALSVGGSYKRQGIGSALVYATMYDCKSKQDVEAVSVMSSADAKPFYGRLGFTFISDTGRRFLE